MRPLNKLYSFVFLLLSVAILQAQPHHNVSTSLLERDFARNVERTPFDDGYVMTGTTVEGPRNYMNLVKDDGTGNIMWDHIYQIDDLYSNGHDVEVTDIDHYIIGGEFIDPFTGVTGAGTLYLDPAGNVIWAQRYSNGSAYSTIHSIEEIPGGTAIGEKYIITGALRNFFGGTLDLFVATLDPAGNIVQQSIFDTGTDEEGLSVQVVGASTTISPRYAVSGYTNGSSVIGSKDAWVMMLDGSLNMVWSQQYGGSRDDEANALGITMSGELIASGWSTSFTNGNEDMFVTSFDMFGSKLWSNVYGFKGDDKLYSVNVMPDGTICASGYTDRLAGTNLDAALIRIDPVGNLLWSRVFGDSGDDIAYSVKNADLFPFQDIFVAGVYDQSVASSVSGGDEIYHIRTNFSGDSACAKDANLFFKDVNPFCSPALVFPYIDLANGLVAADSEQPSPTTTDRCCDCASMFVDFYLDPATFCAGDVVDLINTSTCIQQFRWQVDGVFIPGSPSTTHVFTPGFHTVTLFGRNPGCPIVSKTITVNVTCKLADGLDVESMNLLPNPASEMVVVQAEFQQEGMATIEVIDLLGKTVALYNAPAHQGTVSKQLDISNLESGMYHIVVRSADAMQRQTLVVK